MTTEPAISALPRWKKILFIMVMWPVLAALFIVTAEITVRARGVRPYMPYDSNIRVEPGGKLTKKHPALGYSHIPGEYTITLRDTLSFKVTHLPNTLRITKPIEAYETDQKKPAIYVFGCSWTYGWVLNDEETYTWVLQERFPECDVVNFGVIGYGTIHSLVQFREALEKHKPAKVAIAAYGSFHDNRNTFLRNRRKLVATVNKLGPMIQPCGRLGKDGKLHHRLAEVVYREFPFMKHSALIHYLEQRYNQFEDRLYHSHRVSEAIIVEMHHLAQKNGCQFVLAGIESDSKTRALLEYAW